MPVPSEHPDQAPAFTSTVRTPQCGHTVWGTKRKPRLTLRNQKPGNQETRKPNCPRKRLQKMWGSGMMLVMMMMMMVMMMMVVMMVVAVMVIMGWGMG